MPNFTGGSKNIRIKGYDYRNGYFFITNQKDKNAPYLLNKINTIISDTLQELTKLEGVTVELYQIMPTHIHIILILDNSEFSLSEIWRRFKAKTTLKSKRNKLINSESLWQRNFYEHVIRDDRDLLRIREYIIQNPEKSKILKN